MQKHWKVNSFKIRQRDATTSSINSKSVLEPRAPYSLGSYKSIAHLCRYCSSWTGCFFAVRCESKQQHFQYAQGFISSALVFPSSLCQTSSVSKGRGSFYRCMDWLHQPQMLTLFHSRRQTRLQTFPLPALIISECQTWSSLIGQRTNLVYHQHSYTQSRRRCNYAAG